MKLSYKFYRDNFIKLAILSIGCVGIFWDWFHGQSKEQPGVVTWMAVLMVVGNIGLFFAMRRAKRREDAEKLRVLTVSSGGARDASATEAAKSFADALQKRKRMRFIMECWAIGGGTLFSVFGRAELVEGIPAPWVGYIFILVGILGLFGVNVFYGGPLDLRLDRQENLPGKNVPAKR